MSSNNQRVSIFEDEMQNRSLMALLDDNGFKDSVTEAVKAHTNQLSALQIIRQLPTVFESFAEVKNKVTGLSNDEHENILHWYAILFYIRVILGVSEK